MFNVSPFFDKNYHSQKKKPPSKQVPIKSILPTERSSSMVAKRCPSTRFLAGAPVLVKPVASRIGSGPMLK